MRLDDFNVFSIKTAKLMHRRDIMKMKAINYNDPHDWACFKRMLNKVKVAIRQTKELFYKSKFIESDGDRVKRGR